MNSTTLIPSWLQEIVPTHYSLKWVSFVHIYVCVCVCVCVCVFVCVSSGVNVYCLWLRTYLKHRVKPISPSKWQNLTSHLFLFLSLLFSLFELPLRSCYRWHRPPIFRWLTDSDKWLSPSAPPHHTPPPPPTHTPPLFSSLPMPYPFGLHLNGSFWGNVFPNP